MPKQPEQQEIDLNNTKDYQAQGGGVYLLRETGRYKKGIPTVENSVSIRVYSAKVGVGGEDVEFGRKLATHIANLLNKYPL